MWSCDQSCCGSLGIHLVNSDYNLSVRIGFLGIDPETDAQNMTLYYSKDQLLSYKPKQLPQIPDKVFSQLGQLGIRKSYRGTRGGCSLQRNIKSVISNRPLTEFQHTGRGIQQSNLISIQSVADVRITSRNNTQTSSRSICKDNLSYIKCNPALKQGNSVNLCLFNAQSARNKTLDIVDYIIDKQIELCLITESWLRSDDSVVKGELTPDGYKLVCTQPRENRNGGGIAVIHHSNIQLKVLQSAHKNTFEFIEMLVSDGTNTLRIVVIYHPPYSDKNRSTTNAFLSEFSELLEILLPTPGRLLIAGDFNFHFENASNPDTIKLTDLLDSVGLEQRVTEPTHRCGHTLDLLITRSVDDTIFVTPPKADYTISDHITVLCKILLIKPPLVTKQISFRKIKNISINDFKQDILNSNLHSETPSTLTDLATEYNDILRTILDQHAPLITKCLPVRPLQSWYDTSITTEKQKRRSLERKWRTSQLDDDERVFKTQKNAVTKKIFDFKVDHYSSKVSENENNQKALFNITKRSLLHQSCETPLPPAGCLQTLANDFNNFYIDKIAKIRSSFGTDTESSTTSMETYTGSEFCSFTPLSQDNVRKLIMASPCKSCECDPIPTQLLKTCVDELLPFLTRMINLSLEEGTFPDSFKEATISPLLKKPGLDLVLSNYRPVSNLQFVSKLLERAAANQLVDYIETNNLHSPLQSAYKRFHSTETALVKVVNDILCSLDNGEVVILVLLDLSAAFDTVDHKILIKRMKDYFGVKENALKWFMSYLSNRTQKVSVKGHTSDPVKLESGVPQGSVLGPILWNIYTAPLSAIMKSHDIDFHLYADDNQLYLAFKPRVKGAQQLAVNTVQNTVSAIRSWMRRNNLKFNDDKTECLLIGRKSQLKHVTIETISIGDSEITPTESARNLGVIFDTGINMKKHISSVCSKAFLQLRNLYSIRRYLTPSATETLVHAFISSRLDYCNSLLLGLPDCDINKLQRVQNSAARLVTRTQKFNHITPVLVQLHWLPVRQRITFKVLLMAFKALNGLAPSYMCNMLEWYAPARSLRSSDSRLLVVPKSKLVSAGDRAFSVTAPKLWNKLPCDVRNLTNVDSFKTALKTYLFREAYY